MGIPARKIPKGLSYPHFTSIRIARPNIFIRAQFNSSVHKIIKRILKSKFWDDQDEAIFPELIQIGAKKE